MMTNGFREQKSGYRKHRADGAGMNARSMAKNGSNAYINQSDINSMGANHRGDYRIPRNESKSSNNFGNLRG